MRLALLVLRKELRDHLRDRRSVLGAFAMPVFGPLVFALFFSLFASWSREKPLVLPVQGAGHAPGFVAFLEANGARVEPAPADFEAAVREGRIGAVLLVPERFGEEFTAGRPARVQLFADSSNNQARADVLRIERLLVAYSQRLGALRLLGRGVAPDLATPVLVEQVDVATPARRAASLLTMIPMFLMLAALVGGMNLSIDSTAGERERGSLEPLLLNPVPRLWLVLGKWAASVVVSVAIVAATLAGFAVAMRLVPLDDLGIAFSLGPRSAAQIAAALVPLTFVGAAAQMYVATFARSFKEAQTYLNLMNLVPVVPAMVLLLSPVQSAAWMSAVPVIAQQMLVLDAMRLEPVAGANLAVVWATSLVYAAVGVAAVARLLGRERIVFGR
jgi:sodium transport system permease protein